MLKLRRPDLQDFSAVERVLQQALPDEPYRYAENLSWDETWVVNRVAEIDGGIVGYATTLVNAPHPQGRALWERLPRPYTGCLAVLERYRRQRIGLALIEATIAAVKQTAFAGVAGDHLYLECSNALVPVYRKMGFDSLSAQQVHALTGLAAKANVMRRPLLP